MRVAEGGIDLVFCYVGSDIDREVVGYGGEDDDGANEDGGEETEEEVFDETPSSQPERYVDVLWPACHDALNYPLTARANPL